MPCLSHHICIAHNFLYRLSQSTLNAALRNFGGARKEIVPLIVDVLEPKEKGITIDIIDRGCFLLISNSGQGCICKQDERCIVSPSAKEHIEPLYPSFGSDTQICAVDLQGTTRGQGTSLYKEG